ncbi:MAG: hypothetical protein WCV68_02560 [Candidatus Paceibacterota bacterium]|jgi:hypothetical protein
MTKIKNKEGRAKYVLVIIAILIVLAVLLTLVKLNSNLIGKGLAAVGLASTSESVAPVLEQTGVVTQVAPGASVTFRGSDLTPNVFIMGATYPVLSPTVSEGNKEVSFQVDPREKVGNYEVYVINTAGVSNTLPLAITE